MYINDISCFRSISNEEGFRFKAEVHLGLKLYDRAKYIMTLHSGESIMVDFFVSKNGKTNIFLVNSPEYVEYTLSDVLKKVKKGSGRLLS